MKNLYLFHHGGEGRSQSDYAVDYMQVVDSNGQEVLYAESPWDEPGADEIEKQIDIFWSCMTQLAEQAAAKGIDLSGIANLDFCQYGDPKDHFERISRVPAALVPYLAGFFA